MASGRTGVMNNTEIARKIRKSRQLLEAALKGERNFSYRTARVAVDVIGGTVETWMDPKRVEERQQLVAALKGDSAGL